jgi:iron complex outermembrane receptor protein
MPKGSARGERVTGRPAALFLLTLLGGPAASQTPAVQLETVEVTGSHIRRLDRETSQPVLYIGRDEIARTGATSLGELLQALTISSGGPASRAEPYSEDGVLEVNLRGLGPQRTLVLLNGRRLGGSVTGEESDLSVIPVSAIDHIEVLKDGASAVYGSDAVAGVVNVITRKSYADFELRAHVGAYGQGDGIRKGIGLSGGRIFGATSAFLDLSYDAEAIVYRRDRELTRYPVFGAGPTRGALGSPRGSLFFVPTPENGATLGPELCPGEPGAQFCSIVLMHGQTVTGDASENTASVASRYEAFNFDSLDPAVNDRYNYNDVLALTYPSRRASLFGTIAHRFDSGIELSGELLYTRRDVQLPFALAATLGDLAGDRFGTIYVAADNPFNPFDQDIGRGDGSGAGTGAVVRALTELDPASTDSTIDTYRAGLGLDGELDALGRAFHWQLGLVHGASHSNASLGVGLDLDHLRLALGPSADCAAADCVPINIFGGPGSLTPEMLSYITYTQSNPKKRSLTSAHVTVTNDLLQLPDGLMKAAYGVEYRHEAYSDSPDALIVECRTGLCFTATDGSFHATEGFLELDVPVLAQRPFASALDLSLAVRQSHYSTYGGSTNYKLGMRWKPLDDLLLRANRSTAFRAPGIKELYRTPRSFPASVADPCSDYAGQQGGPGASPEVQENCRNAGVPESYVQQFQVPVRDGGNPDLEPETADTYNAGLVYNPSRLRDITLYADWFRTSLHGVIAPLDPQFILDSCYETPGGSQTCTLVTRDAEEGTITDLRYQPLNFAGFEVEGLDFALAYEPSWLDHAHGRMKLALQGAYLIGATGELRDARGNAQLLTLEGTNSPIGSFPRLRAAAELLWVVHDFQISWRARYIRHLMESCDDGGSPSFTELGLCSHPDADLADLSRNEMRSIVYHDVQLGYAATRWNTEFTVGARNLFDTDPPPSYSDANSAYDAGTYDPPGVFVYLRAQMRF